MHFSTNLNFIFREDSNLKEITCVPCSLKNVQVKATFFCQSCEDPKPLCETCATQHTRQKLTRDHNIVKDILKYFKVQTFFRYFAVFFNLLATFIVLKSTFNFFYSYLSLYVSVKRDLF